MIRTLAMIAVAGFLLSVGCLAAAFAIGGPDIVSGGAWAWPGPWSHHQWGNSRHGFGLRWDWDGDHTVDRSKTIDQAWSGDRLEIDAPADVRFVQGNEGRIVVTGSPHAMDHVHIEGDHVRYDGSSSDDEKIKVELTAPKVTRFAFNGEGSLDIGGYDQPDLDLQLNGDASVHAAGKTRTVNLNISGSGEADLSALATDDAHVTISGSGQARIGPKATAKLDISGSGDVTLLSHPKRLESHVSGSGTINQDEDAAPATSDEPRAPAKPEKPAKPGKKA